ncbi:MAG: hypothetical protein OEZ13_05075 [Spirochaetia bacterium]|nr:hypothetical protein [Spirochaetia bacterium]
MKKKIFFVFIFALSQNNSLKASAFQELRTAYTMDENHVGLDVTQKFFYSGKNYYSFVREHEILLPLSNETELGINYAYLDQVKPAFNVSRTGDIKVHLNYKTDLLKKILDTNFFIQYNSGSGPEYTEFNTHPMESYGFPELRYGFIFFRKFSYFSLHFNLFYVFRQEKIVENEDGTLTSEKEVNVMKGITLNIFRKYAYKRVFGFNYTNEKNFFYYKNLKNDNLEYLLALNTDLAYPFIPFIEFTFNHDFQIEQRKDNYYEYAPGSGYFRSQFIGGIKSLFAEEKFIVKTAFVVPLGEMKNVYKWGLTLGVFLEF